MYGKPEMSVPYTYKRYKTPNKGDVDKISQALAKMMQEDLTIRSVNDSLNHRDIVIWNGRSASGHYREQTQRTL